MTESQFDITPFLDQDEGQHFDRRAVRKTDTGEFGVDAGEFDADTGELAMKTLEQHIEITPNISGGKPRIAGHLLRILDQGYLGIDLGWEL